MIAIVNVTSDWGIGHKGQLNVRLKEDLRHFKEITVGHTVLYGRKTLETFPNQRPLINRENIVLSTDTRLEIPGATVIHDIDTALWIQHQLSEHIYVIGGESVYRALLPYCQKVYLTKTFLNTPSDAFFPNLDEYPEWKWTNKSPMMTENGINFQFLEAVNMAPAR